MQCTNVLHRTQYNFPFVVYNMVYKFIPYTTYIPLRKPWYIGDYIIPDTVRWDVNLVCRFYLMFQQTDLPLAWNRVLCWQWWRQHDSYGPALKQNHICVFTHGHVLVITLPGRVWILNDTGAFWAEARFLACPKSPNPVTSVAPCAPVHEGIHNILPWRNGVISAALSVDYIYVP